jgi:Asp-tRNA(Asn)/Glu-tRNA(Gln) amidotransferase A subunit family amidase
MSCEASWREGDPHQNLDRFRAALRRSEDQVHAWQHLSDAKQLDAEAERLIRAGRDGTTPLWGLPIGIKDTIDVKGLPAERGSRAFAGRRPERDAEVVRRVRAAGALVAGKTVTTELAVTFPGPTTNPHDRERTPGGSSSGSAAAVACGMVPGALGTQTIASTLRPASFCGVVGFKPTHGRVPLAGILAMSPEVDSIGLIGADVPFVSALFAAVGDQVSEVPAPGTVTVGLLRTPWWELAEADSQRAVEQTAASMAVAGNGVLELSLDSELEAVIDAHWDVVRGGIARTMGLMARTEPDMLSEELLGVVEAGNAVDDARLARARQLLRESAVVVAERFGENDFVVTLCVSGVAPRGLHWTGEPIFCQPWSALGFPAISLPLASGEAGLPIGVQLVARPGQDERLLAFADTWIRHDARVSV